MICNPNNPCAGAYGRCLDVKVTDSCNGCCEFCIEKNGRQTDVKLSTKDFIKRAAEIDCESVLILGGEPMLYRKLKKFIRGMVNAGKNVFMTTNGSRLNAETAKDLTGLTGINISIHHYLEDVNAMAIGKRIDFNNIREGIRLLRHYGSPVVRINCNLMKGYVESFIDVERMVCFAKMLGADGIRFAELQHYPDLYVDARTIFRQVPDNAFENGCETKLKIEKFPVVVRSTCGIVNPEKPEVVDPEGRTSSVGVLYRDGYLGCWGSDGCHGSFQRGSCGEPSELPRKTKRSSKRGSTAGACHEGGAPGCH